MGVCQFACSIFCLAAAVILTVFWLMTAGDSESNTNLTFLIVAIKHEWDLKEKSDSCRNGAFIYYGLSVLLLVWGIISSKREASRLEIARRDRMSRRANMSADAPLLSSGDHNTISSPTRREPEGKIVSRNGAINNNGEASAADLRARQSDDTESSLLTKE